MAIRDYSLDDKIYKSAFDEFTCKGYSDASLRNIAAKAQVTIGAIRTRFKTKQDLFEECVKPLLSDVEKAFANIKKLYYNQNPRSEAFENLKNSMENESEIIMDLLFEHYDEAYLLICRSAGSKFENFFDLLIEEKVRESLEFFKAKNRIAVDEKLLRILISQQFHSYEEIIRSGCSKEKAKEYLGCMIKYHFGGFCALFQTVE